jgi:hypothetical protein
MPSMTITVPHQLSQDEAMRRIQNLLSEVKRDHGDRVSDLTETWSANHGEFSFKAMGFSLSGRIDVKPDEVVMKGNYPLAAMPFRGRIESMVRERAEKLLAS